MLAIAGGKGGSGKTTTLGLATALDHPTFVVDADRDMPNLHALADVARTPTLADVAVVDRDEVDVAGGSPQPRRLAHHQPEEPSVSVFPASPTAYSLSRHSVRPHPVTR